MANPVAPTFPSGVADLPVAANNARSALAVGLDDSPATLTVVVEDGSKFRAPSYIAIGSEVCRVASIAVNTLTLSARAVHGEIAAHDVGAAVVGYVDEQYVNELAAEVAAIEDELLNGDLVATEAVAAMGAKANNNPLNHDRYTDGDAVVAMGAKDDSNPLNHDRYNDAEAVTAMGVKGNANPLNHDRYTDAEATATAKALVQDTPVNGVTDQPPSSNWAFDHNANPSAHHTRYTDAEAVAAMGVKGNSNPLNHDRYTNAEAVAAMGAKGNTNPLNHDRYTDAEAVTAMGVKGNTNPLNHDRYTNTEAVAAMGAKDNANPLNHDRYTNAEAVAAVGIANPLTSALDLGENAGLTLDPSLSADGKYSGIARAGTAGATLAFGDLCYLVTATGKWAKTDANSAAGAAGDSRNLLGICVLAAAGDGSATRMLLFGVVRADAAFPAMTIGAPVYVSETAGQVTSTQPVTADVVVRIIGYATTADELFFNPDSLWFTHV